MYNLTAMLAWYNEPPDLLTQAVSSMHGLCDRLIAYDGGYKLTPDTGVSSPEEQAEAIRSAAGDIEVVIHTPDEVWRGQVEKRHALLQAASKDSKWVMPLDADWVVGGRTAQTAQALKDEDTDIEVLHLDFYTPFNPDKNPEETASHYWHIQTIGLIQIPLIYRVLSDMRMIQHHWHYSGVRKDGDRVAYWGTDGLPAKAALLEGLTVFHLCHFRDPYTIHRNKVFCQQRDHQVNTTGVEA